MKRTILLLIVVVFAFISVVTTFAAPPERETFDFDFVYPMIDCGLASVGDFWIFNNEVGSGRIKYYYDKEGNLIKEKGHVNGTDHLFAEGYPETVVDGNYVSNWTTYVDSASGDYTFSHETGLDWHILLPGYGNIIHFSGMEDIQYDPDADEWVVIRQHGLQYFDLVPLCEYLAPPS